MSPLTIGNMLLVQDRCQWREWLMENHDKETEIWLVLPKKSSGKQRIPYAETVEEALCFGWIDSIVKKLDKHHTVQRFTPRRKGSVYSQPNKERLRVMAQQGMIIDPILEKVQAILNEEYQYPDDILTALQHDAETWRNFNGFTAPYRRIRISYVENARKRPEDFNKRLENLLKKTKANEKFGYGISRFY
jgi:uncharacterized protein YdeI (YjbR/CyaY-like superfamily)